MAILAAGTAVAGQFGAFAVPVFIPGCGACILAVLVMRQQRDYYRAARDRMRRVEERHGVAPADRVDTTSTLGGRRRSASVTGLIYLLTGAVAAADLVGIGLAVFLRRSHRVVVRPHRVVVRPHRVVVRPHRQQRLLRGRASSGHTSSTAG